MSNRTEIKSQIESNISSLKSDVGGLKTEVTCLRTEVNCVMKEWNQLRPAVGNMNSSIGMLVEEQIRLKLISRGSVEKSYATSETWYSLHDLVVSAMKWTEIDATGAETRRVGSELEINSAVKILAADAMACVPSFLAGLSRFLALLNNNKGR